MPRAFRRAAFFLLCFVPCGAFTLAGIEPAQEERAREEAALAAPGDARQAARLAAELQGVYKRRFANALVDGTAIDSEDILELVPVSPGALYFRVHLEVYNAHECNLWGVARFTRAGRFVFR